MRLSPGKYWGDTIRQRSAGGLTVTLSKYPPRQAQQWHVHTNPTLFVLIDGLQQDRIRRADFEQRPFTVVFHPTSELHASLVGPQGMLGLNIEYDAIWLERHELTEGDLGGYRPLDSVWSRLQTLHLLVDAFQEHAHAETNLETNAFELLVPLVKQSLGRERPDYPRWLRRAEEFIHGSFRSPIRLCLAAREVGVHPVHLARVFRRRHGCSVGEYVRALRIAEAGRLIIQQGQPIAQAACEAGFSDHAHLCRCFGRILGFCPNTLRSVGRTLRA